MVEGIKILTTKIIIPGLKSRKYWLKELFSCVRYKQYIFVATLLYVADSFDSQICMESEAIRCDI